MALRITFEQQEGYLVARVTGKNTAQNVITYVRRVMAECVRRDVAHILIVENLEGPGLQASEIYQLISKQNATRDGPTPVIAYVDLNQEHEKRAMEIAALMAQNRGLHMQRFDTVSEAKSWLQDCIERDQTPLDSQETDIN